MVFKIPFTVSKTDIILKRSKPFERYIKRKNKKLETFLTTANQKFDSRQYLAVCLRTFIVNLIILSTIFTSLAFLIRLPNFYLQGLALALAISFFVYLNQRNYPKLYSINKSKDIEKNLLSALQDMLVQLNSGVSTYRIIVNISNSNYGEVSNEFSIITKQINSGIPQIQAIETAGKQNNSRYFQRVLWQISNALRAGNDLSIVIKESIRNLSDEQAIQIQSYGSKLNPIIMFFMLIAVIIPSLGITFMIIIFSMLNIPKSMIELIFAMVFIIVIFMQFMFLGLIKSRRPSLL